MSDQEEKEEEQILDIEKEKTRIEQVLSSGLQQLGKTADNSGYSLVSLMSSEKEIGKSLYGLIAKYKHLRYVDLSRNNLVDI